MHRQLVSHVITVPRPLDWASVCSLSEKAYEAASLRNIAEPRYSRLIPKTDLVHAQHNTRDRWEWDWKSKEISLHVEGWVEKE